jgi:hypothetical protein
LTYWMNEKTPGLGDPVERRSPKLRYSKERLFCG